MEFQVGKNIKERRKRLHLSQARLSELSGISQSAISDIENPAATKRPNTYTIQKLAAALQCTVSDLMGDQLTPQTAMYDGLLPDEEKLIEDYRSLNRQGQEYIRQTMYMAISIYKKSTDIPGMESENGQGIKIG